MLLDFYLNINLLGFGLPFYKILERYTLLYTLYKMFLVLIAVANFKNYILLHNRLYILKFSAY